MNPTQYDLTGTAGQAPRVAVYVDETKPDNATRWQYIGLVLVAEDDVAPLVDALHVDRIRHGFDGEVHFQKLKQAHKANLACAWLDRVMHAGSPLVRFHILGLDHNRLSTDAFGTTGAQARSSAYTRMFRSAVSYAVKSMFGANVVVVDVVHDGGDLEHHDFFDWHSLWRMGVDNDVRFACPAVRFVNSDHRHPDGDPVDSHLLQLTDLVVSASRVCLDATTTNEHKVRVARHLLPLMTRLGDPKLARNPNSRYRYLGRCSTSYFPSRPLDPDDVHDPVARARSTFYPHRRPALTATDDVQQSLF